MELIAKESAFILGLTDDIATEGIIPDKWKSSIKTSFQEFYNSAMKRLSGLKETIGEQIKKLGRWISTKLSGTEAGKKIIAGWSRAMKYSKDIKRLFVEVIRFFVAIDDSKYNIDLDNDSEDEIYRTLEKKFNYDYERIYEELNEINDHLYDELDGYSMLMRGYLNELSDEFNNEKDPEEQVKKGENLNNEWDKYRKERNRLYDKIHNRGNKTIDMMSRANNDRFAKEIERIHDPIMDMINNAIENVKKSSGIFNKSIDKDKENTKAKAPMYTKIIGLLGKLISSVINIVTLPFRAISKAKENK